MSKAAPLIMFKGTLPLIAVVQIMMLLELFASFIFLMIFIIIKSKVWWIMIPLPICEIIVTLVIFLDSFVRVNELFFIAKLAMAIVYFI